MRWVLCFFYLSVTGFCYAQKPIHANYRKNVLISELLNGDSLVYYQCHVESAQQELRTSSGHTLQSSSKNLSITEKFVLRKVDEAYTLHHFVSGLTICPNRRFSGLKFKEKKYWEFFYSKSKSLTESDLKILFSIEEIGREANEYNFAVSTENRNQVILLKGNKAKQMGLPEGVLLSRLFQKQAD